MWPQSDLGTRNPVSNHGHLHRTVIRQVNIRLTPSATKSHPRAPTAIQVPYQSTARDSSGVRFYPDLLVNNVSFMGALDADGVMEDVCNSMVAPPAACARFMENFNVEQFKT
jgi:hypothetical protein